MKIKKSLSLLGFTLIIANLSYASLVMAQASSSTGQQTISCNTRGAGVGISVSPPSLNFENRSVTFYSDSTDAPLTSAVNVDISDDRGYDVGTNPGGETCGFGGTLSVSSSGLTATSTTLALQIGSDLTAADITCNGACSPSAASIIATAVSHSSLPASISAGQNLVTFSEAFSGNIRTNLNTTDLEVTRPAGPISPGNYSGNITFTFTPDSVE